ncbi:cadmium-translocating P-type ATPase [Macrococcus brunensis]|uniref:Cd(2+)-exporting ATPase n=1 Tax=Macrococcus brunensis TaxID=198483 RepID=A0A4R6BBP8_9STAP|nr:heavy metal translocating P-type ATPase [Macrococcus brunensis]TDL95239.1 cadmium-translocating P-type ATPase [Macrococcus brunensis]
MNEVTERKTYRIQNLSCSSCAKTYEENLKALLHVQDAEVNHVAAKIYITGDTTIAELEKAGAFDNVRVRDVSERQGEKESFWKKKENYPVYAAAILIIISFALSDTLGEHSWLPAAGYLTAMGIGGYLLFITGVKNLIRLKFDMNTLMTIAVIGAALIGEWQEGATVVILFAVSEALERYSMDKARQSIHLLMDAAPSEALILRSGIEQMVNVADIQVGDVMIVKPGQKVAMDGKVIRGQSTINQAAITGESVPVTKNLNDEVFAGTLNEEGLLEVEVTKLVEDTTILKIIHLVEEAQGERAPSQAFIDRFAKYYTPVIMLIAFLVMLIPPLFLGGSWHEWLYQGLAVLIIGCPCALVVSTPVAIVTAIGNAARQGVLIKGGIHLEEAGHIDTIAFDKTGTLTRGIPAVTDIYPQHNEALTIAAALEKGSQHPLATAVVRKAEAEHLDYSTVHIDHFQSLTGRGVKGEVNGRTYYMGSPALFESLRLGTDARITEWQSEGKTVILFGSDCIELMLAVADQLRPEVPDVLNELHKMKVRTMMLTGDNERTGEAIGKQAGLSAVQANLMPEDKLNIIQEIKRQHTVAMIGDGVNDAPALAAADIGIAMSGSGTETALETADIALMSDDLKKLPYMIRLSKKTLTVIKQNIAFSLLIKVIALLLIIPGWLTLWIAIFSDIGATLIVTLNSMRLLKVKDR